MASGWWLQPSKKLGTRTRAGPGGVTLRPAEGLLPTDGGGRLPPNSTLRTWP